MHLIRCNIFGSPVVGARECSINYRLIQRQAGYGSDLYRIVHDPSPTKLLRALVRQAHQLAYFTPRQAGSSEIGSALSPIFGGS
jgi:hypothetical protein